MPAAAVPVFQVSMPHDLDAVGALRLGAALAPLRGAGVLILGSGSLTHNLMEFGRPVSDPGYAQAFADWVRDAIERGDRDALAGYRSGAPHARRAHVEPPLTGPSVERAAQRDRTQVHNFVRGIHVEGKEPLMLFIEARQRGFTHAGTEDSIAADGRIGHGPALASGLQAIGEDVGPAARRGGCSPGARGCSAARRCAGVRRVHAGVQRRGFAGCTRVFSGAARRGFAGCTRVFSGVARCGFAGFTRLFGDGGGARARVGRVHAAVQRRRVARDRVSG